MRICAGIALAACLLLLGCQSYPGIMVDPNHNAPVDAKDALLVGQRLAEAGMDVGAMRLFRHAVIHGDETLRTEAFVELYLLGVNLFAEQGERCQPLDLAPQCDQILYGCANEAVRFEDGRNHLYVQLALGPDPHRLVFGEDRVLEAPVAQITLELLDQCFARQCRIQVMEELFLGQVCHVLPSIQEEVALCLEDAAECDATQADCSDEQACTEQACELGQRALHELYVDWPELVEEARALALESCEHCQTRSALRCQLVFADACTGQTTRVCEYDGELPIGLAVRLAGTALTLDDGRTLLVLETP
ncbi:MAG: hypothetical protein H0U74_15370 [Bradymonadaceae bacterium]|nr:hypothetical protein [Lujinxingiaceae bacterium]